MTGLEQPRLLRGCCLFEDESGLVVRSSHAAYRVAPAHRDVMQRVLGKLDGRHNYTALLGSERTEDAFYAMGMLRALECGGLLADGAVGDTAGRAASMVRDDRLAGVTLALPVESRLSWALGSMLRKRGATVIHQNDALLAKVPNAILVVSPDGPDLALLEFANRVTQNSDMAWAPAFPFGDAMVVGPLIWPRQSPCFRCFELRWLGISPSIALERSYFAHLRRGAWKEQALRSGEEAGRVAALIAPALVDLLSGKEPSKVTLFRPEQGSSSSAVLQPHAACEACAADSGSRRNRSDEPADFTAWYERPVSLPVIGARIKAAEGFCGLAAIVPPPTSAEASTRPGLPHVAVARFALPEPDEPVGDQSNWSHGSAGTREDAETLAIIEALERFTGLSSPSSVISASYEQVAGEALLPTDLPLFSAAQYRQPGFPFQPFDPSRVSRWRRGFNLTTDRPVLVPATAAWYGQDDELLGETSSGVAAHSSRGYALLNGALELVERDAFMIHWLNRLSPPLVDLEELDYESASRLVCYVQQIGYAVRLADMTTDLGIPAFLSIGFRTDCQKPALIVGAGASLDPSVAAARALDELCCAAMQDSGAWMLRPPVLPEEVLQLEDHCRAYQHPDWLQRASFLWASDRRTPLRALDVPADPLSQLTTLIDVLRNHGHDLIGVDITGHEVARHGIRVVRAIIPGLQPLGFGRRVRLGGRRLYEAPARMGYRSAPAREEELNTIPHCFP